MMQLKLIHFIYNLIIQACISKMEWNRKEESCSWLSCCFTATQTLPRGSPSIALMYASNYREAFCLLVPAVECNAIHVLTLRSCLLQISLERDPKSS